MICEPTEELRSALHLPCLICLYCAQLNNYIPIVASFRLTDTVDVEVDLSLKNVILLISLYIAAQIKTCTSDFIYKFGKLPFPSYLGKYFIKIGKISAKIHEIGKIKAIFGLGMTPI